MPQAGLVVRYMWHAVVHYGWEARHGCLLGEMSAFWSPAWLTTPAVGLVCLLCRT